MDDISVPELDPDFSAPGATATPWVEVEDVLRHAPLWMFTSVRRDGRPHTTPLQAVWWEDRLHIVTGASEQKYRNLVGSPACTLATGGLSMAGRLDVVVEGSARRVVERSQLEGLAAAWPEKYGPDWSYRVGDGCFEHDAGEAQVLAIRATKILAFAKQPLFSQTRYLPTAPPADA